MASFGNVISLFLGFIEMLIFPNVLYGFPFANYVYETEKLFMNETCNKTQIENGILCEDARKSLARIWTFGIVVASLGPMIFGFLQPKIGMCSTRIICGLCTTLGLLLMSFYKYSSQLIFWGTMLASLPALSYIVLNTVIARVYPRIAVILVVMVPGLINSSATSMLISKKLWQNFGLDFDWLLFYLCLGTIIVHIRTLFFLPYMEVPKIVDDYDMMSDSLFGRLFSKNSEETENLNENNDQKTDSQENSFLSMLKAPTYWNYLVWYTYITFRVNTCRGWMLNWVKWTFSGVKDDCQGDFTCENSIEEKISGLIDLFGYLYFAMALIPIIPAVLIKLISKMTGSEIKAKIIGYAMIASYCVIIPSFNSYQMCLEAKSENDINPMILIIFNVTVVPLLFATPGVFLTIFYPIEAFPFLFGLMRIPSILMQLVNEPLNNLIITGDDIGDYEFCPVNTGLGVASIVMILSVMFTTWEGFRMLKNEKTEESLELEEK